MKKIFILLVMLPQFLFGQFEKGVNPVKTHNSSLKTQNSTRAVVIGISDYQEKDIPDLRFADRDAEAFANFLRSPAGGSLDNDHLQVLINQNATAGQVAAALDALIEQTTEGDEVIIYFSGHGDVERKTISQPGFLLCWDAPARVYMGGGTYSLAFLQEIVTTLSTQNKAKVLVVTDACHAGKLAGNQIGGSQLTAANLAKQFSNEVKILSCQPGELSLEGEQWGGGRGVFSYHLIDGLFGLADRNADGQVSVGEIDRYLEDKVTAEAAPQSQVPMLLGNKTERLATVNTTILADLKKSKAAGLPVFAATEGRGFEDEILAKADSSVREMYFAFKKAVREKRFFPVEKNVVEVSNLADVGQSADELYAQLSQNQTLAPLHGMMRRNYAAALQDDAQQAMNIWLKADVQQLECIGNSLKLEPIPRQLERAAELLGEKHYIHRSLQARKLLFEGIVLRRENENPDEALGRKYLTLFRQSAALEVQSALPWCEMAQVFAHQMRQPDSAFVCARQAHKLAPNWVLPFTELAHAFEQRKPDLAKLALEAADSVDSLHPYVINRWAMWHFHQPGAAEKVKAVALMERYRENDGAMYSCWYNNYSLILESLGETAESEAELSKALALDSTNATWWNSLGFLYNRTSRFVEAEPVFKKAIALDSSKTQTWNNLGVMYIQMRRWGEAELVLIKAVALDSTYADAWNNLGYMYNGIGRYTEAELALKKAISLDSTFAKAWSNLGVLYFQTRRFTEAEPVFLKIIALDSTEVSTRVNLGLLYTRTRRFAEAEQVLKKAIALDSTFSASWNNLGQLYNQTRRFAESEPVFKKAIALDSTNVSAWSNLGFSHLQTRRFAEAEPIFKKAIALDSTFANPRKHLGMVCFKTKRPDEARQNFLKSIELNSNFAPAMLGMAYLLHSENKISEALNYVEQAILKKTTFEQLETDEDLAPLRALPDWKVLMKKHFPDKVKD